MIIKIEYNGILSTLEIDDNETVLTLKLLISEMLDIPLDKLIIKLIDGPVLVNDIQKIYTFSNEMPSLPVLRVTEIKEPEASIETNKNLFMNLSNMDLSSVKPLLKDKKFMKNILENNPMFKDTFENNQEMKAMLNSGHLTEEIEKFIDDPEYMKEQMKNGDLAMQKIENIPGGLSQINSYMEKIHDPLRSMTNKSKSKSRSEKDDIEKYRHLGIKSHPLRGSGTPNMIKYINHINYLDELGFKDFKNNLILLETANGDLDFVIESLKQKNPPKKPDNK